jgi:flagellar biosynthetic protein FlhB
MSDIPEQDRTEEPTPRRREEARREGRIVFSAELTAGAILLSALLAGPVLSRSWRDLLHEHWLRATQTAGQGGAPLHPSELATDIAWLTWQLGGIACLLLWLGSWAIAQLQTGPPVLKELKWNWEKLNPAGNWHALASQAGLLNGWLAVLKFLTAILGGGVVLIASLASVSFLYPTSTIHSFSTSLPIRVGLGVSGSMLCWGVVDYVLKWRKHESQLRMTRDEVRREMREDSGDPHLRQRRRQQHRQALERQGLANVSQATVVVKNPTHYAVALRYETGQAGAPKVVAKGQGLLARRIISLAEQAGIPVLERRPIARVLYHLAQIGEEIPVELFHVVAEVLAHVYRLRAVRPPGDHQ